MACLNLLQRKTMEIWLVALVLFAVAALLLVSASAKRRKANFAYKAKAVMTQPEQVLFFRLVQALPDQVVLAQVQMCSFLRVDGHRRNGQALGNRIRQKSADFVICRPDSKVLAVIELQDATHERPERQKSDEFKRKACQAAGLRLVEFHVRDMPSVEGIRKAVLG